MSGINFCFTYRTIRLTLPKYAQDISINTGGMIISHNTVVKTMCVIGYCELKGDIEANDFTMYDSCRFKGRLINCKKLHVHSYNMLRAIYPTKESFRGVENVTLSYESNSAELDFFSEVEVLNIRIYNDIVKYLDLSVFRRCKSLSLYFHIYTSVVDIGNQQHFDLLYLYNCTVNITNDVIIGKLCLHYVNKCNYLGHVLQCNELLLNTVSNWSEYNNILTNKLKIMPANEYAELNDFKTSCVDVTIDVLRGNGNTIKLLGDNFEGAKHISIHRASIDRLPNSLESITYDKRNAFMRKLLSRVEYSHIYINIV